MDFYFFAKIWVKIKVVNIGKSFFVAQNVGNGWLQNYSKKGNPKSVRSNW